MKKTVSFMILLFSTSLLFAQKQMETKLPDEQIKVERKYDDAGNLIRFDSTYVKSWSSDSTIAPMDMEAIQKEMESMFEGGLGSFFSDSTANDPFEDLHDQLIKHQQEFFDSGSRMGTSDSTGETLDDLDQMHEEMMSHLNQFFQTDSLQTEMPGFQEQADSSFFFDQKDMENMKKQLEEHFDQFNKQAE